MPSYPLLAQTFSNVRSALFSTLAKRLKDHQGPIYALHIGDTWLEPALGCRLGELSKSASSSLYRYAPVSGLSALREAVVDRVSDRFGRSIQTDQVLISAGATGGLNAAMSALLQPNDEVLILAPCWPLITGIVRSALGVPVCVPFFGEGLDAQSAVRAVEAKRSARTVALYINTPNNPTGALIPPSWLAALVAWARANDLWILSDEVYDELVYEGEHHYLGALAPERTVSVFSFSKAYGLAGHRVGYAVGPASVIALMAKASTYTYYSAPTVGQHAALCALKTGDSWLRHARECYQAEGIWAAERLGVLPPKAGSFLFVDVAEHLDEGGLERFLERLVDRGLLVAPGPHFGPYATHLRLCFTSAPPQKVREGVEILAQMMGR